MAFRSRAMAASISVSWRPSQCSWPWWKSLAPQSRPQRRIPTYCDGGRVPHVAAILAWGAEPQIAPAVVQAVAVDVVHDHPLGRLHDLAVHPDNALALTASTMANLPLI